MTCFYVVLRYVIIKRIKLEENRYLSYFVLLKFIQHGDFWVNFENYVKNIEFYSEIQRKDENNESY